jgi:hypothetical protein
MTASICFKEITEELDFARFIPLKINKVIFLQTLVLKPKKRKRK